MSENNSDDGELKGVFKKELDRMSKLHPSKYRNFLNSKHQESTMVFGKPNVLINEFGLNNNEEYVHKTLNKFSVHELISMANTYSAGKGGQNKTL